MWKIKNCDSRRRNLFLELFLGSKVDTWPVVGVRHEGVIVGVPHSSPDTAFLIQRFRVVERHAFQIDIFHQLVQEGHNFRLNVI